MTMNAIGETFSIDNAVCREFNPNELLQLLKINPYVFMSWGANNFIVDNKKRTRLFRMTVNGYKHKGFVYIVLNGLDLFDVYLTNKKNVIVDVIRGLYFDMLTETIDKKIENENGYM